MISINLELPKEAFYKKGGIAFSESVLYRQLAELDKREIDYYFIKEYDHEIGVEFFEVFVSPSNADECYELWDEINNHKSHSKKDDFDLQTKLLIFCFMIFSLATFIYIIL